MSGKLWVALELSYRNMGLIIGHLYRFESWPRLKMTESRILASQHWARRLLWNLDLLADEEITENKSIEPDKKLSEIRPEPYSLPDGFAWDTLNLDEPLILTELYSLLNENYVEDDDSMFRFDYQPLFLKWLVSIGYG